MKRELDALKKEKAKPVAKPPTQKKSSIFNVFKKKSGAVPKPPSAPPPGASTRIKPPHPSKNRAYSGDVSSIPGPPGTAPPKTGATPKPPSMPPPGAATTKGKKKKQPVPPSMPPPKLKKKTAP